MTRRFVTLHDEAWIKKHCICREVLIFHEKEWLPKAYKDNFVGSSSLLADDGYNSTMYRSLVGKTVEVEQQPFEPKMNGYGFRCADGAPYSIPTWLIKAYWEVTE